MSDDYEPYQWQVGDPADWGDSVGVPDIPYMGYLNGDDDDEDEFPTPPRRTPSQNLHDEAWRLRNQGRYEEALDLINRALEYDDLDFDNWNVKAIILEDMLKYDEAIRCYDEALRLNPNAKTVKNNKAYSLSRLAEKQKYTDHDWQKALELINEALKLVSDDDRKYTYIRIKGNILGELGRKVDAWACYLLSDKMYDELNVLEEQKRIIESSKDTLINITGTRYCRDAPPLLKGVVVELVKESENIHDHDAIRVERNGETVGYVANSSYTLVDGVKSATQIKDIIDDAQKAEVMFRYAQDYIIAKLI